LSAFSSARARALHVAGVECSEAGNDEGAIENYTKALILEPERGDTLYNLGLIHKYRGDWVQSFEFNRRARVVRPDDEATLWNLAIAATALRDWSTAREVWRHLGVLSEPGEGPIDEDLGSTPVRLNADTNEARPTEVVWSERLCPVRSRIMNIPTGETGFRYGDVVLHDGAPVGYRLNSAGQERAVFNVLELFEASRFSTYEASVAAHSPADVESLISRCEAVQVTCEDWTASLRSLCRACSEGRPHEGHDRELTETVPWTSVRRVGFAAQGLETVKAMLADWGAQSGGRVSDLRCTLDAETVVVSGQE
jgi:hypothetical protein